MKNVLSIAKLSFIYLIATAGLAFADPVVHTSGPNFGARSVGANELSLTASGGDGVNYAWQFVPGFGELPPGMAVRSDTPFWFPVNARAGLIGVATTPGTYHFRLRASSGGESAVQDYTLVISSLVVKDQYEVFEAFVGEPYSYSLTAQRNGVDVTASFLATGGIYPPGVSISPTGILEGTPTTPGTYDFSFRVTEAGETVYRGARIVVKPIHITTDMLPAVLQNGSYLASITATGGSNAFSFSASGLPSGLVLGSASGSIAGTVSANAGLYSVNVTVTDVVSHASVTKAIAVNVVGTPAVPPSIAPRFGTFQDVSVGQPFGQEVAVRAGGRAPFLWTAAGLPDGASIRFAVGKTSSGITPGDVELWGNVAVAGVYNIVFTVTDADDVSTSNTFPLRVSPLQLVDSLGDGTFGSAYSSAMRVIGGDGPYSVVAINGRLPLGLTLTSATQRVSGTPGETGNFNVQFRFSDVDGHTLDVWNGFNIVGPSIFISTSDNLGTIQQGAFYSNRLFECCTPSANWSVADPSTLPPGIALSPDGVLSGTPGTSGTYTFLVKSTDSANAANYALRLFTLIVTPVQVTTSGSLPFGNVGSPYGGPAGFALSANGGTGPYSWSVVAGTYTPPGTFLTVTGILLGTPTSTGQYSFTVKVTDATGKIKFASFTVLIYPQGALPPPAFNLSTNLGTVSVGLVDGFILTGVGGNGLYSFTVPTGSPLPPGLDLRNDVPSYFPPGAPGLIGVATTPGTYDFQLAITSAGMTTVQTFRLKVVNFVVKNLYSLPDTFVGRPFSSQLIALRDGAPVPATWTVIGALPAGVFLSPTGELHGTPAAPGFYNINFNVSDGADTVFRNVNYNAFALNITTSNNVIPNVAQGANYTSPALTSVGGSGVYTYSVSGFTGGLGFDPATGVLSGVLNAGTGILSYTITATDTSAPPQSYSKRFSINVLGVVAVEPLVTTFGNPLRGCTIGVPCDLGINLASGGTAPFTWQVHGAPMGMDVQSDTAVTSSYVNPGFAQLWGTPTELGEFDVTLTVTDATGVSASNVFRVSVSPLLMTSFMNNGVIDTPYATALRVIGGVRPYTVTQAGGQLPAGLTVDGAAFAIAGTPRESGNFNVTVKYVDAARNVLQVGNSGLTQIFINGVAGKININTSADLGSTGVLAAFARQLNASTFGCCATGLTWSLYSGALPMGVTLSEAGLLQGNPTVPGVYTFVIRATDNGNAAWFAGRQFTLNVTPLVLTTNTALPFGNVGTPYSIDLVVNGAAGAVAWTVVPFYTLPPGLSLAVTGGVTAIVGTPTLAGQFQFNLTASDGVNILTRTFTLSIYPAGARPPLNWTPGPFFSPVAVGVVSLQLSGATDGFPPYHYSYTPGAPQIPGLRVQDGQPLPTFFPLNVTAGLVGVATTPAVYNTSLRVTDSRGNTFDRAVTLTVAPMTILSQNTWRKATRLKQYLFEMQAYPAGAYNWTAANLPQGLNIDPNNGVVSGIPQVSGNFSPSVTLRDAAGNVVTLFFNLTVGPFEIETNGVLPDGTALAQYANVALTTNGCGGACTWSLVNSTLPAGMALSPVGLLSGTPTVPFNGTVTIQAAGPLGNVQKIFSLRVNPAAPQPLSITSGASAGITTIGNNVSFALAAQGGAPPYSWSIDAGPPQPPLGVSILGPGDLYGGNLAPGVFYLLGRAMQSGGFNFTVRVRDQAGATTTRAMTMTVSTLSHSYTSLPVTFSTNPVNTVLMPLVYGTPYSQRLLVLGGTGSYTHASAPLPTGLVLDPATGTISGTPINTGFFQVPFQATDTAGNTVTSNINLNIAGPTPTLVNFNAGPNLGTTQLGATASITQSFFGGVGPYTLTAITPLPPGFAIQTGSALLSNSPGGALYVLAGTALAAGTFSFTIEARDSQNNVGARTFTLTVAPLTLGSGTNLPDASVGVPYSQQLLTWDNTSAAVWTAPQGLPPGLTLAGNVLSGTPTNQGQFDLTLNGSDATGAVVSLRFNLRVSVIAITDPQVLPDAAFAGVTFRHAFTAVGGGVKTWSTNSFLDGFSLSNDGVLTGKTNSFGGIQSITVTVSDGVNQPLTRRFTFYARTENRAELDFSMAATNLLDGVIGQNFTNSLLPSGGLPPYSWSVAQGSLLPAGMRLIDVSTLGQPLSGNFVPGSTIFAGAPVAEGRYVFDLILRDAAGASLRRTFTWNVSSITILPGPPRTATAGVAYAQQFIAVGGTPPYTFSISAPIVTQVDMLPPGFAFSATGLIAGTTSSTGNYAFVLRVRDAAGRTFSRTYINNSQLTVNNAAGWRVFSSNPSDTKLGTSQFLDLFTSSNSAYTWSLAPGSVLPPGLELMSDVIVGRPTVAGTSTFTVRARDNANGSTADHTFTLVVVPMELIAPLVKFTDGAILPAGQVGSPSTFTFRSAGGTPPYTYSALSPLPPDMSLSSDGVFSGTPTSIGNYLFAMTIADAAGNVMRVPDGVTFVVTPAGGAEPLVFQNDEVPDASVGQPFSLPIDPFVRGGRAPFSIDVIGGAMPPGLKVFAGGNGVPTALVGIPTTPGPYTFTITIHDSAGQSATATLEQNVSPLALAPGETPPGIVGTPYRVELVPSGGMGPYQIELDRFGDMPPGLTFSAGILSGIPTTAGDYVQFAIVTDGMGNSLGQIYFITIDNALGEAPAVTTSPRLVQLNYLQGAPGSATIPIAVNTTTGSRPFTAQATGITGASVTPSSGIAPGSVNLNLDVASLAEGRYLGAVGVHSTAAANLSTYTVVDLNVRPVGSDTVSPSIVPPAPVFAEATSSSGAIVMFAMPTATDNFYPAPRVSTNPPSGSQFPLGPTTVSVTATDSSGNVSQSSFIVTVRDTTPPVLTLPANITAQATSAAGANVDYVATASDLVDGSLTPVCVPPSHDVFPLNVTTTVNCTATDPSGNPVQGAFEVRVVDTIAPTVTVFSPIAGGGYVRGQSFNASYACFDAAQVTSCRGPVEPGTPFDTSTLGAHEFIVETTDSSGNRFSVTTSYHVIELPRIVVTDLEPIYGRGAEARIHYNCPNATTCGGGVANGGLLDTSSSGIKHFIIDAADDYGNSTSLEVTYAVSLGMCVAAPDVLTARLTGDGTASDEIGGNSAWVGMDAYEPGMVNEAFSFGSGSYVTLPIARPGSFTLQAWVRTTNRMAPAGTGVISTGVSGQEGISAQIELDGFGNYQVVVGSDLVVFIGPATSSFQHIAVTYDQATAEIWTYLNGQPSSFDTWIGSPDLGIQILNLGVNRQLSGDPFAGAVDDVQVFDRALTADRIQMSFLTGASGLCLDHAPIAVATVPAFVEANTPTTGDVRLDGRSSSDPDSDPLTFRWTEGASLLSTDAAFNVALPYGTHHITLTVHDGHHKQATANVIVVVQDTLRPVISNSPGDFPVEASSAAGGEASWNALSAVDMADGMLNVSCTPASGSFLPRGPNVVECSAVDLHGNRETATFTVTVRDTTPPFVNVAFPVDGATFARFEDVKVAYTCSDAVGVASCIGSVPNGSSLDTSVKGSRQFVVTATDISGIPTVKTVTYRIVAPPTVNVRAPIDPIVPLHSDVTADYDCDDAMACDGDVLDGARLDTSTPGPKSFTINATGELGNNTIVVVTYYVSEGAPIAPIGGLTAWLAGDGNAADEMSSRVGTWQGTPAFAAGRVAQAFSLGGSNSVSFPLVQPGAFTLQFWVKTSNALQPYGTGVVSTGGPGQQSTTAQIELDGAGNYQLNVGNGHLVVFLGPATNVFHHIAVTSDGSLVSVYMDGQPVWTETWTGSPDLGILGLNVGLDRAGTSPFTGIVDEVQVFSRPLSADEVLRTFGAGEQGYIKDHAPVAIVVASSYAIEATGHDGAMVKLDGTGSTDVDHDSLSYTWFEDGTTLGHDAVLEVKRSIGSHAITLVVDDGRFKQGSQTVTVVVQDTTAPIVTSVPADFPIEATGPAGAVVTFPTTPTATDTVDGDVPVTCIPASGSTFPVGPTVVRCTAKDAHLNESAPSTFTVTVTDHTPPQLAGVPTGFNREATRPGGDVVPWTQPTASDIVDVSVNVICVPESGSLFPITTTHVECTARDAHGNPMSQGFDVVVHDQTPPQLLNVPGPLTFEAADASGATLNYTLPTAFDIVDEAVTPTCSPAPGTPLGFVETTVMCSAADSRLNRVEKTFTARAIDSVGPRLELPPSREEEATGPLGAVVTYTATASDTVSGTVPVLCAPPSSSTFAVGLTAVTCSASDGAGNVTPGEIPVVVRDRTPPAAQILTPSVDAALTGSSVTVTVQASDLVRVATVTVNGAPAGMTAGSPQSGTWTAVVPISIVPGTPIELRAVVVDGYGNRVEAVRSVDNDGIPTLIDRSRTTGDDLSTTFSNEFNYDGITSGVVTRNGWTLAFSTTAAPPRPLGVPSTAFWPTAGWVQTSVSGPAGLGQAIVSECFGGGLPKQLRLNAIGQRVASACDSVTGTIAAKALSASPTPIELWKQLSPTAWLGIPLMTGAGVSTGSPTTALPENPGPIEVKIVRIDDRGDAHVVGTFQLAPGASADVSVTPDAAGLDDQFEFRVLRGRVPVTMNGVMRMLDPGVAATLPIDRTPPRIACDRADGKWHGDNVQIACTAEDREAGLGHASDARFSLVTTVGDGIETSSAETDSRTVCDGGGNCAAAPAIDGNRIDRRPPTIDVAVPRAGAVYLLNQAVAGSFSCTDGGSGVASCAGSSASGQPISTSAVGGSALSVVAADEVGNSQTMSVPYAVTYAVELVGDGNAVAKDGEILHLGLRIADARRVNQSNAAVRLRAQGMVSLEGTRRADLAEELRFDARSGAYRLDVKTALPAGSYRLQVTVDGDPVPHAVTFRVR